MKSFSALHEGFHCHDTNRSMNTYFLPLSFLLLTSPFNATAVDASANRHLLQRPTANGNSGSSIGCGSGGNSILNMAKSGSNGGSSGVHRSRVYPPKPGKSPLLGERGRQTQGKALINKKGT